MNNFLERKLEKVSPVMSIRINPFIQSHLSLIFNDEHNLFKDTESYGWPFVSELN